MGQLITGIPIVTGEAYGQVIAARESLSFWGGYDHLTGEITDRRHPLSSQIAAGKILALPFSRGSSTTTAVLLEAVRCGKAPAAIITTGVDSFFALAAIVAGQMYRNTFAVISVTESDFEVLLSNPTAEIKTNGEILVQ